MIFVTGASGNVGKHVARELMRCGTPFRLGEHTAASLPVADQGLPQTVRFDFLDASTYAPAVKGCSAVFLLRPPPIANTRKTLNVFIDAAREAGVSQVVFVSVAGASRNPLVPHHAVEQHLRAGPPGWTILQPSFFMQNLGDAYRQDIRDDKRLYVPAGGGSVAFLDARDLAEVAVMALLSPLAHIGKTYHLTGPDALSFAQVAQVLTRELRQHIEYKPASVLGYAKHLHQRGLPLAQIAVQTLLHLGLRFGQAQELVDVLACLLERAPRRLASYVQDYRGLWTAH